MECVQKELLDCPLQRGCPVVFFRSVLEVSYPSRGFKNTLRHEKKIQTPVLTTIQQYRQQDDQTMVIGPLRPTNTTICKEGSPCLIIVVLDHLSSRQTFYPNIPQLTSHHLKRVAVDTILWGNHIPSLSYTQNLTLAWIQCKRVFSQQLKVNLAC